MSRPAQVNLAPIVQGDTWDGLTNCSFSSDGTAFGDSLDTVRMQFKDSAGNAALTLSSETAGQITITDAAAWTFDVEPRVINLTAGTYSWGIETTDSQGVIKTRVTGIIPIINDPVS